MSGKKLAVLKAVGAVNEHRTIDLGDFNAAYAGKGLTFNVWVMPTREHKEAYLAILGWLDDAHEAVQAELDGIKDAAEKAKRDTELTGEMMREYNAKLAHWMGGTWLDWTETEAVGVFEALWDDNPTAWEWLREQTTKAMGDFRNQFVGGN